MSTPVKKTIPLKKVPVSKTFPQKKRASAKKKKPGNFPVKWKVALAGFLLILLSPFYYGYVIKCFTSTWRWIRDVGTDPHYRTYKSFNIRIPDKYTIHGIDVSYYQGRIDWHKVKNMSEDEVHISFAFIKATEGVVIVDPYFQRNWREGPKAGIICGAYHYFRPKTSGKWQAIFFLQNVKTEKGDLPMVVDVEELNGVAPAKMREELKAFLKYVEAKTKIKPMIYSGLKFYQDNLDGYFDGYNLWIAHYYQPQLAIESTTKWSFWQHSDKAKVSGINHVTDFNVFNGDSLAFRKLLVK
ncbi:glycoside hydrolase family 25 protein [Mucilaginibacter sp. OK098]|uniref:glycoside hydrolase family 25 protein n=1 Tax=Mucilaginibacter sp. OK098 TaxID=1855297 RepID=UPI000915D6A3|nr:glycoside hydrolase family 25 protein [Mucilaginibacter sp. OK098]SHN23422.1 lysozyme [Mucilaginibacter sp. OK098]